MDRESLRGNFFYTRNDADFSFSFYNAPSPFGCGIAIRALVRSVNAMVNRLVLAGLGLELRRRYAERRRCPFFEPPFFSLAESENPHRTRPVFPLLCGPLETRYSINLPTHPFCLISFLLRAVI